MFIERTQSNRNLSADLACHPRHLEPYTSGSTRMAATQLVRSEERTARWTQALRSCCDGTRGCVQGGAAVISAWRPIPGDVRPLRDRPGVRRTPFDCQRLAQSAYIVQYCWPASRIGSDRVRNMQLSHYPGPVIGVCDGAEYELTRKPKEVEGYQQCVKETDR